MKKNALLIFLVSSLTLFLITCKKDNDNSNKDIIELTSTEQSLLGLWVWEKTERYDGAGKLQIIFRQGGISEFYDSDGSYLYSDSMSTYNYYTMQLLDSLEFSPQTISPFKYLGYYEGNGVPNKGQWYVSPNYENSGKDFLKAFGARHNGYIFTLSDTELSLRSTIDTNLLNTSINYWKK